MELLGSAIQEEALREGELNATPLPFFVLAGVSGVDLTGVALGE
jgi:hypothetical protein